MAREPSSRRARAALDPTELREWAEAFDDVLRRHGAGEAERLLERLQAHARCRDVAAAGAALTTPYVNTIPRAQEPPYPGDWPLERQIRSLVRWNAMAMVVRANREHAGLGGHISTYASCAALFEVAFNHFLRARDAEGRGDTVFYQGHAAPGVYARAFIEGRLDEEQLANFRRECPPRRGLSSYPHPWLMPDFWEFPSVSMGLAPLMAIYQARFQRYLRDRGLRDTDGNRVWCFIGDGECDEPESLGSISVAARERLDNLIVVVNCNLQRLDGPVRGNGKIIQELEAVFRGAGWHVLKVIWGTDWDPLLEADADGQLVERMNETLDGEYQKYSVADGSYVREQFFGRHPQLRAMVEHLSDDQLRRLARGGHDSRKIYAAYRAALEHRGAPTVILAKTLKGYGLGEAGEGRNVTHQQKKLNEDELAEFRSRFGVPVPAERVPEAPFYRPPADRPEMVYLRERREALGGWVPARRAVAEPLAAPDLAFFAEFLEGSGDREVATTMAFVRLLRRLMGHPELGARVVPIIPDEARTFGMDALFRRYGIYSHVGQLYQPVDQESLLSYREATDGQILEEGITEAGARSSFIAAGTAYAQHGLEMLPFYTFYSMFGFQRIGDLVWAAADSRAKGFLLGGTAGRTTLAGEGLQHQDGHSQLVATTVPNLLAYDPAYAYEVAVIVREGLARMFERQETLLYYLTLYNEAYPMPSMPEGAATGIVRGMYRLRPGDEAKSSARPGRVQLLGSGPLLREALRARQILADRFDMAADAWSVTSYSELRRDALAVERWNLRHPGAPPRRSYLGEILDGVDGPFVAVSDYVKLVPEQIARFLPGPLTALGTDGFGRSDTRAALRRHFEVDAEHVAYAALHALAAVDRFDATRLAEAAAELGIDPDQADPVTL
ncbi:MAG TPA: pyruvate dehydrogenase (acetyl-transferring), homodimeric type [Candidatus Limnocylindrales bacterium]|nr:pyruvate dehydrogenase (acetyl-transferring), homodimeric type [Candidatus Limnocylindrales bacterium]